ncbi:MAG: hypothetical protein LBR77_06900 [Lachnospiraceae bacterium]|nr:hypothetical protein [Lachnospiraceae bacterium]
MAYDTLQKLYPEEEKMPLARFYYDYPMKDLPKELKDLVLGPPVDCRDVVKPEDFINWLKPLGEYEKVENGYCMFPDGSGYIATYFKIPDDVEAKKLFWYLNWLNIYPKSAVYGHGNLRYKIWNPADHFDHYFVNWKDTTEGVFTTEHLDLGEGERYYDTIRHPFNLREYGLTQERIDELTASGISVKETSDWESFDEPGAHLTMGQIRKRADGGFERRSVEWIGWRPGKDGQVVREPRTQCDEAYLRKVGYHTLLEWYHLMDYINDLYDTYSVLPADAD